MKISDIIYRYSVPNKSFNDGICRLRVFCNNENQTYAILTEISKNTSTSITNSIEVIIKKIIESFIVPSDTIFIEHYESEGLMMKEPPLRKVSRL
jgi:hypothetical protein